MKHCSIIVCHYAQVGDNGDREGKITSRSELMKESLKSLVETADYPAELIVIDNGGNPDDSDYLLELSRKGVINILIRNKGNMHFGFAWNQGAKLAGGDFLCFTCNDMIYEPKWLSTTVGLLEKYSDRKLIATPYITLAHKKQKLGEIDGNRLNLRAGSACMIITPETYREIGLFQNHRIAGTLWHDKMIDLGYRVIAPPVNMAREEAFRHGSDYRIPVKVKKILMKGEEIDLSDEK